MEALRTWIVTLISVSILCTLVEKFAPQGSMNKYVRLVCGLAMTVVIAMPAIQLLKGDSYLERVAWSDYAKLSEGELKKRIERLEKDESRRMLEVYRNSLIRDIMSRFRGQGEFIVKSADAVLYEDPDSQTFGMLRALYLTLEPRTGNHGKKLPQSTLDHIRNELSQVFSIDRDKILIDTNSFNGGG